MPLRSDAAPGQRGREGGTTGEEGAHLCAGYGGFLQLKQREVRLWEVAVVCQALLPAHGEGGGLALVKQAGFLDNLMLSTSLDQLDLCPTGSHNLGDDNGNDDAAGSTFQVALRVVSVSGCHA